MDLPQWRAYMEVQRLLPPSQRIAALFISEYSQTSQGDTQEGEGMMTPPPVPPQMPIRGTLTSLCSATLLRRSATPIPLCGWLW